MSLNGLEAVEVSEAYQSALNEGGGWFLLKYNTRDEVALLQKGKGGVAEAQEVVHGYEEESPLYGFIHYRRRKVVLKYVPEGTSRLLLARLAVHFEFIKERFSPYDTIFTFAEAYELSDSTLSSTCSLHTAASIKSLRDSPSRNLAGVKEEDGSENGTVRAPGSEAGTIRSSKIGADITEESRASEESSSRFDGESPPRPKANGTTSPGKSRERTSSITTQSLRPRTASNTDKDLPPTPKFASPYTSEKPGSIYDHSDFTYRSSIDTRISSNSARPSIRELNRAYDSSRPKIKVGPRPSIDSGMRPDATSGGEQAVRPVASLPSSIRLPSRKGVPPRPNSQQSQKRFTLQIPRIPSQGSTPAPPPVTPVNATAPMDKIPSMPTRNLQTPVKTTDPKSPKMTPEKRRLMKALEIRKKQMAAQQAAKASTEETLQENEDKDKAEDVNPSVNVTEPSSLKTLQQPASQPPELEKPEEVLPQEEDRDMGKEIPREVQDSPISAPEPSDGPSTQASSITEEEEVPLMYKQEDSEANVQPDSYKDAPGLQDIIREQTQGPVVTVEEVNTDSSSEVNESRHITDLVKEPVEEQKELSQTEQEAATQPKPVRQGLSNARAESDAARDSAKTTSIVSEASSVRTETGKPITPPAKSASSPEEPPEGPPEAPPEVSSPIDTPNEIVKVTQPAKPTEFSTPTPQQELSENQKETSDDATTPGDIEEPESPFFVEGHSVQTSASPSVVNLLDGLSATTHNESVLPSHTAKAIAPIQVEKPSLFNMVGGFGDSEDSIETPLSAVREEPEVTPSQSENEKTSDEPLPKKDGRIHTSNDDGVLQSKDTTEQMKAGNQLPLAGRSQSPPNNKGQATEDLSTKTPPAQKTRPRTTSKTFQFPSKSRSLSRGEKPPSLDLPREGPSLDLPREGTHSRKSSERQSSDLSVLSANDSRRNTVLLNLQKVQFAVEPEVTPRRSHSINSRSEKRADSLSGVAPAPAPAPEAISHASSKALRLLGFDAGRPGSRSDGRPELASKRNSSVQQEASSGVERASRSEVSTASKLDAKAREDPPELKVNDRSEGSADARSGVQSTAQRQANETQPSVSNAATDAEKKSRTDTQTKRRGVVEPVKRVSTPEASEEQFLSDDSFMEELKSAKLQEAKPVSVSRSSFRPDYLRSETDSKINEIRGSRIVSNPLGINNGDGYGGSSSRPATAVSLRSFSGTILPRPDVKTSPPPSSTQAKKFGVSSGISQRIKALETKTSRPNSPILPTPSSPSPGFLNLRKSSFSSERNYDLRRSRASTAYPSPQASPEIGAPEALNQPYQQRGETVSVTATIVRDPNDRSPRAPHKSAVTPTLNLHESPLVVEHEVVDSPKQQIMGPPQYSPLKPPRPRYSRYSTKSASSSSTEPKADAAPHSRRGSVASMRSGFSSRDGSETDLQRAMTDKSPNTSAPLDNIREEKRMSRSSRLLKRMSSVTSLSRRSIAQAISPSPKTASIIEHEEDIEEKGKPFFSTVDLGDVNIQFPDTLLWKRRRMTITDGGVLTLSASQSDKNPRILTKTYPLSDFRPPYVPDQDRQELPNSILLDFHDGSSLQCACEHPGAQGQLLKVLRAAHAESLSQ